MRAPHSCLHSPLSLLLKTLLFKAVEIYTCTRTALSLSRRRPRRNPNRNPPLHTRARARRRATRAASPGPSRGAIAIAPMASLDAPDDEAARARRQRDETEQRRADVFKRLDDHLDRALRKVRGWMRSRQRERKEETSGVARRRRGMEPNERVHARDDENVRVLINSCIRAAAVDSISIRFDRTRHARTDRLTTTLDRTNVGRRGR